MRELLSAGGYPGRDEVPSRCSHRPTTDMADTRDLEILDGARFEMLSGSIGPALEPIVEKYLSDCGFHLETLHALIAEANYDRVRSVAHQLKGASSSLGLLRLEQGFSQLESCAAQRLGLGLETVVKLRNDLADAGYALRAEGRQPTHAG